jgi:hypothetical protein
VRLSSQSSDASASWARSTTSCLAGADEASRILGARRPRDVVPHRLEKLVQRMENWLVATGDENTCE